MSPFDNAGRIHKKAFLVGFPDTQRMTDVAHAMEQDIKLGVVRSMHM